MRDFRNTAIFILTFLIVMALGARVYAAEEINFQWSEYTSQADGFKLYMDTAESSVGDDIAVTETTVSTPAPTDGKCHNFWLRAFAGDMESGNSAIAKWCPSDVDPPPATQPPAPIGGFIITTTTTVTPN